MANAVLDGVDGILLGQETLRGGYPVEAVQTVVSICKQAGLGLAPCWGPFEGLLGAFGRGTLRGGCPVEAVQTGVSICKQAGRGSGRFGAGLWPRG